MRYSFETELHIVENPVRYAKTYNNPQNPVGCHYTNWFRTLFLKLTPEAELVGSMKLFNDGINAAIYLMPFIKAVELICGIAFLLNRYVLLASIAILPITINIFLVHCFIAPEGLLLALIMLFCNLFLIYSNKEHYKNLLTAKLSSSI